MPELTEEEYNALDEHYTKNPPKVDPTKEGTGFFSKRTAMAQTVTIDNVSADYLTVKAMATQKTPAQIISDMIHEKIAVGM